MGGVPFLSTQLRSGQSLRLGKWEMELKLIHAIIETVFSAVAGPLFSVNKNDATAPDQIIVKGLLITMSLKLSVANSTATVKWT